MFLCSRQFDAVLVRSLTSGVAPTVQNLSKFGNLFIMKYVLPLCIFTAFFISLAKCDCTTDCENIFMTAVRSIVNVQDQLCPLMHSYLRCIELTCEVDLSPYRKLLEQMLQTHSVTCDLNAASRTLSGSLLTLWSAMLLTAYRIFNLSFSLGV